MQRKPDDTWRTNCRRALSLAVVAVTLGGAVATVHAADHLKCFKVKDNGKFNAAVALTALQEQFGVNENCTVKGKANLFCVPVEKTVQTFEGLDKNGASVQIPLAGDDLIDDRVCYKVKCPKVDIAPELVTDQFGSRNVEKFKAQFLCTPAIKGAPTTTTLPPNACSNTTPPQCGGTCAAGEECVDSGQNECVCLPLGLCANAAPPQCGGTCPSGEECVDDGQSQCVCQPTVPCEQSAAPQCGGACPNNLKCLEDPNTKKCVCL